MSVRVQILVICCAGALAAPAAQAQTSIAPPGKSGADQYFETIPSARGNVAPPSAGTGASSGTLGRLASLGKDGQAAAALAKSTAPATHSPPSTPNRPDGSGTSLRRLIGGSDSGGLGIWLPILFGASLIGAIAFAANRLRHPDVS